MSTETIAMISLVSLNLIQLFTNNSEFNRWVKIHNGLLGFLRIAEASEKRLLTQREQIIALCNRQAQPGVNGQTHEVCYRILQILGGREASK